MSAQVQVGSDGQAFWVFGECELPPASALPVGAECFSIDAPDGAEAVERTAASADLRRDLRRLLKEILVADYHQYPQVNKEVIEPRVIPPYRLNPSDEGSK
jgi:hypothetical protein